MSEFLLFTVRPLVLCISSHTVKFFSSSLYLLKMKYLLRFLENHHYLVRRSSECGRRNHYENPSLELQRDSGASTVQYLKNICASTSPSMIFLSETMSDNNYINFLANALNFDNHHSVDARNKKGGIAVFWKQDMDVQILLQNSNFIIAKMKKSWSFLATGSNIWKTK